MLRAGEAIQIPQDVEAAAMNDPVIAEIESLLRWQHEHYGDLREGEVADYIPELTKTPADLFGIAVTLHDGRTVAVGDASYPFTIQSISKVYTFPMLLDLIGREGIYSLVGVQPSSDPFNAITLDPRTNRPFNPMVNTGAIAVAGRLREVLGPNAFEAILDTFSRAAGRALDVDEKVFESERQEGHRNRAIGHLLRAAGVFHASVDEVLDLYFRQCSVLVTAEDLAMMGATLSNLGAHPVTRDPVFGLEAVRDTLSVMFGCGMYDGAGDWATRVGLPAKSGVGGGIMGVVNRQLGVGVFSPRLDEVGNSVRGKLCCIHLSENLGMHPFDATNAGSSFFSAISGRR
ncbi:glutaminase A [Phenylobacterium sp. LjRoot225]|uniref:glutaminase A n=1 Tax=Phenylobacterium sp. LjRoot225 TaxID=3342285 RepID=UPI003F501BF8